MKQQLDNFGQMNQSQAQKPLAQQIQFLEGEQNNYIDSSEVVIEYYKNQHVTGLEKHFLGIDDFIKQPVQNIQDNKPLLILADEGSGKKTLLVKWMEYHKQNKIGRYEDIIIPHFASSGGNNSNYFFALYRILIKLREYLNIAQKVELLEEKLRKYFAYWIDVCSKELDNQIINDSKVIYDKIILIFEGIDHFTEQNHETNIAFWLPRFFPHRFKVIVTADKNSESMQYFQKCGCQVIDVPPENNICMKMVDRALKRPAFISDLTREKTLQELKKFNQNLLQSSLFVKTYISTLVPYPSEKIIKENELKPEDVETVLAQVDFEVVRNLDSLNNLFIYILDYFQVNLFGDKQKFIKLIILLTITQKGLSLVEIVQVSKISIEEWLLFMGFFKIFMMTYRGLWIVNNNLFKKSIEQKYFNDVQQVKQIHEDIADCLDKTPNSIRKLEEQTFHLYKSKSYFKLKEIVSTVENFLLLFNPNNKYDLCRYWQCLEEQGFDPVIEYNKAIEGFYMHYHPSMEDIFRIIVQISRFLKEFADFETYYTPKFRHPPIQGIEEELEGIGLLQEIQNLQLLQSTDPIHANKQAKKVSLDDKKSPEQKILEQMDKIRKKLSRVVEKKSLTQEDLVPEQNKIKNEPPKKVKIHILNEIERQNVDIPTNRQIVREYYIKLLGIDKEQQEDQTQGVEQVVEQIEQQEKKDIKDIPIDELKLTLKKINIIPKIAFQKELNADDRIPTDYYYKRWLWIQFPWACLSMKCDYSAKLKQCFSSATKYMTVNEEKSFTKQALKIAIEARLKKKLLYAKSEDSQLDTIKSFNEKEVSIINRDHNKNASLLSFNNSQIEINNLKSIGSDSFRFDEIQEPSPPQQKKTFTGLKQIHGRKHHKSAANFFITEDYLNLNTLQKEIDAASPTNKKVILPKVGVIKSTEILNTTKVLNKTKIAKEKSRAFDIQSIDHSVNQSILPRLKNQIYDHSAKEMQLMQNQAKALKQEYDNLIYTNNKLAIKLKSIKTLSFNEGGGSRDADQIIVVKLRLEELAKNKEQVENAYLYSILQKERLRTILKICADNKQTNEEWIRSCNYLLNNLKTLIRMEDNEINQQKESIVQITKVHENYVKVFNEKMSNQKQLIKRISQSLQNKQNLDDKFLQTDILIEQQSLQTLEKLNDTQIKLKERQNERNKINQLEKNNKSVTDKRDNLESLFRRISEFIDLSDPNYPQSQGFIKFLVNIEKRNILEMQLMSAEDKLEKVNQILEQDKGQLMTHMSVFREQQINRAKKTTMYKQYMIKKQFEKDGQPSRKPTEIEVQKQLSRDNLSPESLREKYAESKQDQENKFRQLSKLNQIKLDCFMSLSTITEKLQIPPNQNSQTTMDKSHRIKQQHLTQFDFIKILENLDRKNQKVRQELLEEDYRKLQNNQFDFNKIYKSFAEYYQDPILANMEIE